MARMEQRKGGGTKRPGRQSEDQEISEKKISLTPKEMELCNLIKGGLANKEIAELLNITLRTVESHRKSIRRKLGIANQDINLTVYLQTL